MKLWQGMLSGELDPKAEKFNASFAIDQRMIEQDISGSIAHARMLGKAGILSVSDTNVIIQGLFSIQEDRQNQTLTLDYSAEDVHSFIENELIRRIGEAGKKLHTARSRNDQVTTDLRLYVKAEIKVIKTLLSDYIRTIITLAEQHTQSIMPGYTHLQVAQPVTFAHYLAAYGMMALRDFERLDDCLKRVNQSPLGSCALAGTSYPINREITAELLGFDSVMQNSMDAVSDRDYVVELQAALSLIAVHLSRQAEEFIMWSSPAFDFIEIDDQYATGSSIMPQKKNPDMAELIRGKSARVISNLIQSLIMLKGLPLAYSKDMQEDKASLFDSIDTVKINLEMMIGMLKSLNVHTDNMLAATKFGYPEATDLADYLVNKGIAFRTAHHIVAQIISRAHKEGKTLAELPLEVYREYSRSFDDDLYKSIDLQTIIDKKTSLGGPAPEEVKRQLHWLAKKLNHLTKIEGENHET